MGSRKTSGGYWLFWLLGDLGIRQVFRGRSIENADAGVAIPGAALRGLFRGGGVKFGITDGVPDPLM
jgi:hypothetical protein